MPSFCGLLDSNGAPVPLRTIAIHADVRGLAAAISAELLYENLSENDVIECEFVFPLADTAAVYKLEVEISGRKFAAECRERQEAEEIYEDAIKSGYQGALLESEIGSNDIFRILLGNLPPKEKARVVVGYVQPLEREPDGVLTLNLPNVLNPRYFPPDFIENPEKMAGKFQLRGVKFVAVSAISYEMTFDAKITLGMSGQIRSISPGCDLDQFGVTFSPCHLSASAVLLSKFIPDHDFRLHVVPVDPWQPVIYVEPGLARIKGASSANWLNYFVASAWFEPKSSEKPAQIGNNNEYWLVIDRSGSMEGSKISHAKEALLLFVKSLPIGCKFNIVGFGTNFNCLFSDGSVDYTEDNAAQAVKYSKELVADMDGTEILAPLRHIYSKVPETAGNRFIIILTDGEVGNIKDVIQLARENAKTTRVFAIGIGEGASTALVNGLARASGGLSEFVRSETDRLQAKVIALLKATTNPATENVNLDWKFKKANLLSKSPSQLSTAIYHGRSISQFAIFDCQAESGESFDVGVKMTASIGGNRIEFDLNSTFSTFSYSNPFDAMPLHRLAAKARLLELANEGLCGLENEAVAISIATGILCDRTAFVAVDQSGISLENSEVKEPKFVFVDCAIVKQYNLHLDNQLMCCALFDGGSPGPYLQSRSKLRVKKSKISASKHFFGGIGRKFAGLFVTGGASSAPEYRSRNENEPKDLVKLISLQKIDGSWQLSGDLAKIFCQESVEILRKMCLKIVKIPALSDDFIATLIGVTLLRFKFADKKDEWQMIEEKAVSFLVTSNKNSFTGKQLDEIVENLAKHFSLL